MRSASSLLSSVSGLALAAALLTACAVGPDFTPPDAPPASADASGYDSTPTADKTADGAQVLKAGEDVPAEWWGLFHSDALNKLILQAIKDNPDLAAAEASLRVAQDNLSVGDASLYPTISGAFSSQRQKVSGLAYGIPGDSSIYNLHEASVSASYNLDVFGGNRRAIEELQAQADMAGFQKEAAYLALTGNVVTAAIGEASLRDQLQAAHEIVDEQTKILKILKARLEAGAVAKSVVAEQESSLASAQANVPLLEHQLAVTRHQLSILIGQMPQNAPGATFTLADLKLPEQVPLSLPSRLVAQRPDILAATENLHAASAAVGVAVAARLPQITLSADIGTVATQIGKLFSPGGGLWDIGGNIAQTIFDGGALAGREDAARDELDVAAAQYRKTVLMAFQDVADALHALQSDAETLNARLDAAKAAAESLSLAKTQFEAGSISSSDLFLAQAADQSARSDLVRARAQRYADTAALFVALGGGWWNRDHAETFATTAPLNEGASHD